MSGHPTSASTRNSSVMSPKPQRQTSAGNSGAPSRMTAWALGPKCATKAIETSTMPGLNQRSWPRALLIQVLDSLSRLNTIPSGPTKSASMSPFCRRRARPKTQTIAWCSGITFKKTAFTTTTLFARVATMTSIMHGIDGMRKGWKRKSRKV